MAGFIFGEGTDVKDPRELARRRAVIDAMLAQGQRAPQNVGEGIYSASKSITDALVDKRLRGKEDAARQEAAGALPNIVAMLNGGQGGGQASPFAGASAPSVSAQPLPRTPDSAGGIADETMVALGKTPMGPYRDAIASIESAGSGDYAAVGPTNPRLGRALGRYQIMEANIGPWSREVLGREVTPDEFLANPQLQDAIFDGKFGGYVEQFGPEGAAQAWFAGPGGVGKTDRKDVLGTSVGDYTQKFSAALGGGQPQGGGAPAPQGNTQQTFNPEVLNQLAALASNPYASPGQQQIAQMLMQSQMQQMMPQQPKPPVEVGGVLLDPNNGYQPIFDSRKADPGYQMVSPEEVQSLGLPPGAYQRGADGKISPVGGTAPTNNITLNTGADTGQYLYGTEGGVPAGWRVNVETGEASPIPGGPVATEVDANAQKAERTQTQGALKLGTTLESLNLNIADIEDGGLPVTGAIGDLRRTGFGRALTGDGAVDFGNRSNQITDAAALAEIQNMRDNSPTGGAVGSLTDGERVALGNARTAMNASTSGPEYVRAAKAYRKLALDLAYGEGKWELQPDGTALPKASDDTQAAPAADDGVPTFNPQTGQWE